MYDASLKKSSRNIDIKDTYYYLYTNYIYLYVHFETEQYCLVKIRMIYFCKNTIQRSTSTLLSLIVVFFFTKKKTLLMSYCTLLMPRDLEMIIPIRFSFSAPHFSG